MKFGLSDEIWNILFCQFLYSSSSKPVLNTYTFDNPLDTELMTQTEAKHHFIFSIPAIIHPNIANIKMKELVHDFRSELLIFDLEKKTGIVFNLPDILQCGLLGISGVSHSDKDCWKFLECSLNLLKRSLLSKEYKHVFEDFRSDLLEFNDIISRVRMIIKRMEDN